MIGEKYIINDKGQVVAEPDLIKWGQWFENSKKRQIGNTKVSKYRVSTVFLGLDYSYGEEKPLLFETMVFENKLTKTRVFGKEMTFNESLDEFTQRYSTLEEAKLGHKLVVKEVKKLSKPTVFSGAGGTSEPWLALNKKS